MLKNGDKIEITYLRPCVNGDGSPNPYIGMSGTIVDFDGKTFDLFTGTSWLVGIEVKWLRYKNVCDHGIKRLPKPEDGWTHSCGKCGETWCL